MKESRNYYRILGVQPDADLALIRRAWRTWMQKLRMHPDLGGDPNTAADINTAYQVLSDPRRRAKYDVRLLTTWNLRELAGARTPRQRQIADKPDSRGNRRNYYRLLGVQPEAPRELIESVYPTLCQDKSLDRRLLDEAHAVLADTQRRETYDAWLQSDGHHKAAAHTTATHTAEAKTAEAQATETPAGIGQFCLFCKMPHCEYPYTDTAQFCFVCGSPLHLIDRQSAGATRLFERWPVNQSVNLQASWPEHAQPGRLRELTPGGLKITVAAPLLTGATVRIEAAGILAVAEVVHCQPVQSDFELGLKILSAAFEPGAAFINTHS